MGAVVVVVAAVAGPAAKWRHLARLLDQQGLQTTSASFWQKSGCCREAVLPTASRHLRRQVEHRRVGGTEQADGSADEPAPELQRWWQPRQGPAVGRGLLHRCCRREAEDGIRCSSGPGWARGTWKLGVQGRHIRGGLE